jgi:hypothetical protein
MTDCYFCGEGEEENKIIVTAFHNPNIGLEAPICHVCHNRADVCRDPIVFEGCVLEVLRPRLIYGRDWEFK